MSDPAVAPKPAPSPTPKPEPPVKPLPPTRPDEDEIERPSRDTRPLAKRKNSSSLKTLNGNTIEEIGEQLGKNLIKRLNSLKNLPQY